MGLLPPARDLEDRRARERGLEAFQPIRRRKAAEEVIAVLADAIAGGIFEPGEHLPTERDLAARLEVSRRVVREAYDVLRSAGVISVRRGNFGGTRVESLAELKHVLAGLQGETRANLRSLLEVRRSLELTAALLVAERATADDLNRLRMLVRALEELGDRVEEFVAIDARFHVYLAKVSGNAVLAEYQRGTLNRILGLRAELPVGHVPLPAARENQRTTMTALESRSPRRITRAMDEHMAALEDVLLGERLRFAGARPAEASARAG